MCEWKKKPKPPRYTLPFLLCLLVGGDWDFFLVVFCYYLFLPLVTNAHGPRHAIHNNQPSGLPHFWNLPWTGTTENGSYKPKTTLPKFSLIMVRIIKILEWEMPMGVRQPISLQSNLERPKPYGWILTPTRPWSCK